MTTTFNNEFNTDPILVDSENPILKKKSELVTDDYFSDDSAKIKPIASLLIKEIQQKRAYGISACQIGIDLAIFAMETSCITRVCINPEIVAAVSTMELAEEGCLSFPNIWLKVRRPRSVIAKYKDISGKEITEQLEGIDARVFLHEYDHLQGIRFVDRVSKLKLDMSKKRLKKLAKRVAIGA